MKVIINILICLLLGFNQLIAQDPFFSQCYSSPLYLNPALAGTADVPRFSLSYRNQYPSFSTNYVTYNASYDQFIEFLQGGVGFNLMHDVQGNGIFRQSTADVIYAYSLMVNPEFIVNAGLQAAYGLRTFSIKDFVLPDMINPYGGENYLPNEDLVNRSKGFADFSLGFFGYTRFYYGGFAIHHLTRPNMSYSFTKPEHLPRKLTVHGGFVIPIYERRFGREALKLNPNLVYFHQKGHRQINYGFEVIINYFLSGMMLRQNLDLSISSLTILIGYSSTLFSVGYSYDFNLLAPYRNLVNTGAHEVTFSMKFQYKDQQRKKQRAIKCPKF